MYECEREKERAVGVVSSGVEWYRVVECLKREKVKTADASAWVKRECNAKRSE